MADELGLYVKHGLSPQKALEAGTINTGRLFRIPEVGYLEPGWHADMIVVRGDPLADIHVLRNPTLVIKAGEVHEGLASTGAIL
jgi:imidazolonepropionase-like amidohydrolase